MTNLNQIDLNVRLQLLGCKYSELANIYANNLKYGLKCAPSNLSKLLLLNAIIEILECYRLPYDKAGVVEFNVPNSVQVGWNIELTSNGTSISGLVVTASSNANTVAAQLVAAINTYQATVIDSGIVATVEGDGKRLRTVRLATPCTNPEIIGSLDTGVILSETILDYLIEGECDIDRNCFTEEEIQALIDTAAKLAKQCFQPIGFNYEIPEGYTLNDDGILIPD